MIYIQYLWAVFVCHCPSLCPWWKVCPTSPDIHYKVGCKIKHVPIDLRNAYQQRQRHLHKRRSPFVDKSPSSYVPYFSSCNFHPMMTSAGERTDGLTLYNAFWMSAMYSPTQPNTQLVFPWHPLRRGRTHSIGQLAHQPLLTHWGLVTPFDNIDLGQHWLR